MTPTVIYILIALIVPCCMANLWKQCWSHCSCPASYSTILHVHACANFLNGSRSSDLKPL